MVACSRKRKSVCQNSSSCKWIVGKGCRKKSPVRSRQRVRSKPRCKENQILNPETNRCVKRYGVIGRRVIEKMRSREREETLREEKEEKRPYPFRLNKNLNVNRQVARTFGSEIISIIAHINKVPEEQVVFIKRIGAGAYGQVYIARIIDRLIIIKFEKYDLKTIYGKKKRDFESEFETHMHFYEQRVGAPKPYFRGDYYDEDTDTWISITGMKLDAYAIDFGLFEMHIKKKVEPSILNYILDSIDILLDLFCKNNLVHGDLHWGNLGFQDIHSQSKTTIVEFPVMVNNREWFFVSPLVIDFGLSSIDECNPDLELAQLLRTLYPQFTASYLSNRNYIYDGLMKLVDKYGKTINRSMYPEKPDWSEEELRKVDKIHSDLFIKYAKRQRLKNPELRRF